MTDAARALTSEQLRAELRRRDADPRCTGIAADWCPVCGDCECPDSDDLNDPGCALHRRDSLHAELE